MLMRTLHHDEVDVVDEGRAGAVLTGRCRCHRSGDDIRHVVTQLPTEPMTIVTNF
jgi:hypothetical protein